MVVQKAQKSAEKACSNGFDGRWHSRESGSGSNLDKKRPLISSADGDSDPRYNSWYKLVQNGAKNGRFTAAMIQLTTIYGGDTGDISPHGLPALPLTSFARPHENGLLRINHFRRFPKMVQKSPRRSAGGLVLVCCYSSFLAIIPQVRHGSVCR